jgi:hypothetical protein
MKKLLIKIRLLFGKGKKLVEKAITPAIKVVNILKEIVESPITDAIVKLTPISTDDAALSIAKSILPKALLELEIIQGLHGKTNSEIVATIVNEVRQFTPDSRAQFYEDLAVKISDYLSDGKVDAQELADLVKYIYDKKFSN